jgi:hypothetical protein
MITKRTTLIVGAGASHEYDLPLGAVLKRSIMRALDFTTQEPGDSQLVQALQQEVSQIANSLVEAGTEFSKRAFAYNSIDEALHAFSHDEKIVEIGKMAIASQILTGERNSKLADRRGEGVARIPRIGGWLSRFFSLAVSGLKRSEIGSAFSNVKIINFNYDRCIEFYLYNAILASGVDEEIAKKTVVDLASNRMIRPYGSLGPLPWQGTGGTDFGFYRNNLHLLAQNLRTFTETLDDNVAAGIATFLQNSDVVMCLGFGFAPQNMRIMQVRENVYGGQTVFATACKIEADNYPQLKEQLKRSLRKIDLSDIEIVNLTCTEMLDNLAPAIGFAVS